LQHAPAAWAAPFAHRQRPCRVGTHPVPAYITLRVNALHGEPGQILHRFPQRARCFRAHTKRSNPREPRNDRGFCSNRDVVSSEKPQYIAVCFPQLLHAARCALPDPNSVRARFRLPLANAFVCSPLLAGWKRSLSTEFPRLPCVLTMERARRTSRTTEGSCPIPQEGSI
jgi:hypothetical protein